VLGIKEGKKDEFMDRICTDGKLVEVDDVSAYNQDKYCAIDGKVLKSCDRLAAFIEAVLSISYGVKSRELISGRDSTKAKLKEISSSGAVDFYKLAEEIEEYYNS
jgi:putative hydrolase of HD superfamily